MWVVKGKTVSGKDVEYKVPAGRDTDKAFVMALAFQEHGKVAPDDALTAETTVNWTSDSVVSLKDPFAILARQNFAVDKRVKKGVWERHSVRAYRTIESATEALESAASEFPNDMFRIVATATTSDVVAVSKNAFDKVGEQPDAPTEETSTSVGDAPTATEAPTPAKKTPARKAA